MVSVSRDEEENERRRVESRPTHVFFELKRTTCFLLARQSRGVGYRRGFELEGFKLSFERVDLGLKVGEMFRGGGGGGRGHQERRRRSLGILTDF